MELLWFIPAYGDGRYLGTTKRGRAAEYGYYKQVAAAADYLGYTGVYFQLVKDVKTLGC